MNYRECPNLLKSYKVVAFANIPQANKAVSKKIGYALKIFNCLNKRSEWVDMT